MRVYGKTTPVAMAKAYYNMEQWKAGILAL